MAAVGGILTLGEAFAGHKQAGQFELPPLGYAPDALEPFIDVQTMTIHHGKHHQTYVDRLNAAVAKESSLAGKPIEQMLKSLDTIPESVRKDIRNHGGGHSNHSIFWKMLKKDVKMPDDLAKALTGTFGSIENFNTQFADAATKVFGSGWAWLVVRDNKLVIESTPNQDTPLSTGGFPALGIDVWEHAYYLKYQNRRAEYIKAFMSVVNWDFVAGRLREG